MENSFRSLKNKVNDEEEGDRNSVERAVPPSPAVSILSPRWSQGLMLTQDDPAEIWMEWMREGPSPSSAISDGEQEDVCSLCSASHQ